MSDYKLQTEVTIKSSPANWGTMVELFNHQQWLDEGEPTRPPQIPILRYSLMGSMNMPRDTNPVIVWLNKRTEEGTYAEITANTIPRGARLRVLAKDEDWPLLKESWEILYAEMVRQGFDPQPLEKRAASPRARGNPSILRLEGVSFEQADKSLSKYLEFPVQNGVCRYTRDNTSRADAVIYRLTSNGEFWNEEDIELGTITIIDDDGKVKVRYEAIREEVAEKNFIQIAEGWYGELLKIDAMSKAPASSPLERPDPDGAALSDGQGKQTETNYLEDKIREACKALQAEGLHPTDELVAARLPQSRKGQAYSREWVNKKRNEMRKRGEKDV